MFPKIMVPQIIHFNRVFHYKPSILGYPYFWKHPFGFLVLFGGLGGDMLDVIRDFFCWVFFWIVDFFLDCSRKVKIPSLLLRSQCWN